jgi:hypothetical protein
MAANQYDVIVVRARCAGSPTAMLLGSNQTWVKEEHDMDEGRARCRAGLRCRGHEGVRRRVYGP